jgi:transposase
MEQGASIVQAYALPTAVGRFDLTSFNVYHAVNESANDGVLAFGHSKDRRPDLLQFKQSLGTLDPLVSLIVNPTSPRSSFLDNQ